jgi:quinol monooxygenase YgiN
MKALILTTIVGDKITLSSNKGVTAVRYGPALKEEGLDENTCGCVYTASGLMDSLDESNMTALEQWLNAAAVEEAQRSQAFDRIADALARLADNADRSL